MQYTGYVINRTQDIGMNTKADMAKFCNADAIVRFIDIWFTSSTLAWARSVARISRRSSEPQVEGSKPSGPG